MILRDEKGHLLKGTSSLNPHPLPNSGQFLKGQIPWNKELPAPWTVKFNKSRKGLPAPWMRKIVNRICRQCGTEFKRRPSWNSKGMFCGHACTNKWRGTEEFRKAQSKRTSNSQKHVWKDGKYREKMSLIRKTMWESKEFREKMKSSLDKSWDNGQRRIDAKNRMLGSKHPNWQGGKSYEQYPPEFNKKLRETIRFRDGYKCQVCGSPQIENGRALIVHHKDCDKKNNDFSNLISVCDSCHVTIHWRIRKEKSCVSSS